MAKQYDYTLGEWLDHTQYFAEQSLKELSKSGHEMALEYFPRQYSDPAEARHKMIRFLYAQTYLDQHWNDFEAAGFALTSSKTANQSRHLAIAVYRFYSHAPDETLRGEPPPADFIIELAREN